VRYKRRSRFWWTFSIPSPGPFFQKREFFNSHRPLHSKPLAGLSIWRLGNGRTRIRDRAVDFILYALRFRDQVLAHDSRFPRRKAQSGSHHHARMQSRMMPNSTRIPIKEPQNRLKPTNKSINGVSRFPEILRFYK
jgi:hypothetical protein